MFTGIPPFANTPDNLMLQLVVDRRTRPVRPTPTDVNNLTNDMWSLIEACWAHNPKRRPSGPDLVMDIESSIATDNSKQQFISDAQECSTLGPTQKLGHHSSGWGSRLSLDEKHGRRSRRSSTRLSNQDTGEEPGHASVSRNPIPQTLPSTPNPLAVLPTPEETDLSEPVHHQGRSGAEHEMLRYLRRHPSFVYDRNADHLTLRKRSASNLNLPRTQDGPNHLWEGIFQVLLDLVDDTPMGVLDNALQSTRSKKPVNKFALTVWSLQYFKRAVKENLKSKGSDANDVLFVPPFWADMIYDMVADGPHGFPEAAGVMLRLWECFSSDVKSLPARIYVLDRHWEFQSRWVVHRYVRYCGIL